MLQGEKEKNLRLSGPFSRKLMIGIVDCDETVARTLRGCLKVVFSETASPLEDGPLRLAKPRDAKVITRGLIYSTYQSFLQS